MDVLEYQRRLTSWIHENGEALAGFRERDETFEDAIDRARRLQKVLWAADWSRWGWPESVGGLGGGVRHRAALYETLAEAGISLPEPCQLLEVAGQAVLDFAPAIAAEHLQAFAAGDEIWTLGFSEPGSGSDLTSVRTTLTRNEETGTYRVGGQKTWNGLGHLGQFAIVLCRSPAEEGSRKLTMVFVPLEHDRVVVRPIRAITGRNEFAEVFFDEVEVDEQALIGGYGGGWDVITSLMQYERGTYGWPRQSRLHRLLDEIAAEAHPHDALAMGELVADLAAARLTCRESLRALEDRGDGGGPGPAASIDNLLLVHAEQSLVEAARRILHPAVVGADDERAKLWRHDFIYARALSIFGGTNEIQRNIVAERILGLPREGSRA